MPSWWPRGLKVLTGAVRAVPGPIGNPSRHRWSVPVVNPPGRAHDYAHGAVWCRQTGHHPLTPSNHLASGPVHLERSLHLDTTDRRVAARHDTNGALLPRICPNSPVQRGKECRASRAEPNRAEQRRGEKMRGEERRGEERRGEERKGEERRDGSGSGGRSPRSRGVPSHQSGAGPSLGAGGRGHGRAVSLSPARRRCAQIRQQRGR